MKGSKGLAHSETQNLDLSLKKALKNFKISFACLDWEYMTDRKNGELFCDIGITTQPDGPTPLVGLYRMDCLEASFGVAGFKRGISHTLNTLSMFGGLQAESPSGRSRRTHVAFRSSYNLAYETTRQNDNKRNLFEEKEVFSRSPQFHSEMKSVKTIYRKKARNNSYGVRDEFRVGGEALDHISECIHEAVRFQVFYTIYYILIILTK